MDACETLRVMVDGYPGLADNLDTIKRDGLEKWAANKQKLADNGFRYSEILSKKAEW